MAVAISTPMGEAFDAVQAVLPTGHRCCLADVYTNRGPLRGGGAATQLIAVWGNAVIAATTCPPVTCAVA